MRDNDGIAAEVLLDLFGVRSTDNLDLQARRMTGALLVYELIVTMRALAKSMRG